jgi:hypothetical protein
MIANIASDDALILPHRANPAGLNFRERHPHEHVGLLAARDTWLLAVVLAAVRRMMTAH